MKKLLTLAIATVFGLSSTLALATTATANHSTNLVAQDQTAQTTQAAKKATHHKKSATKPAAKKADQTTQAAKKAKKHSTKHVKAKSADSKKGN